MSDQPYANAETEIAEEIEEAEDDALVSDAEVNEAHPNEEDLAEAEEEQDPQGA